MDRYLEKEADIIVKKCMNIKHDESVLVITDSAKRKIGDALYFAAEKITPRISFMEVPIGKQHGEEPDENCAEDMLNYDVIFLITEKSLSHTKARRDASAAGARIASMPSITEDVVKRCIDVDYNKMKEMTDKIKPLLENAKQIRVTTKLGTDVTTSLSVVRGETGFFHKKGDFGNLPVGEVDSGVKPSATKGTIVVDASLSSIGKLRAPLKFEVEDGYVKVIEGKEAEKLYKLLEPIGRDAYKIAEFGIGTNPKAIVSGIVLEDEKVLGTVHFALGNDLTYNGTNDVPIHLDGVITKPTIYVDDHKIMEEGNLLI